MSPGLNVTQQDCLFPQQGKGLFLHCVFLCGYVIKSPNLTPVMVNILC